MKLRLTGITAVLTVVLGAGTADAINETHYRGVLECTHFSGFAGEPELSPTYKWWYVGIAGPAFGTAATVRCEQDHLSGNNGYAAGSKAFVLDRTDVGQVVARLCRYGGGEFFTDWQCEEVVTGDAFFQSDPVALTFASNSDSQRSFYGWEVELPFKDTIGSFAASGQSAIAGFKFVDN